MDVRQKELPSAGQAEIPQYSSRDENFKYSKRHTVWNIGYYFTLLSIQACKFLRATNLYAYEQPRA